jgi:hypothetical protein
MRQAEDLILRDYIVSAASQINAGGGSNGRSDRVIAVVKSSLIEVELCYVTDNTAQALLAA